MNAPEAKRATREELLELRRISAHMGATEALLSACALLNLSGQGEAARLLLRSINTLQQRAVENVMERTPT